MASLNGQTIASSYEQLLHVDRDGGGNDNTLVSVKDGDNGTTFGIKLATNKVEIIPGSNDANAFEVSQADGTAVLTVDSTNARIGIGGAPLKPLHILDDDPVIRISDANSSSLATATPHIEFYDRSDTNQLGMIGYLSTGDGILSIHNKNNASVNFSTNNVERLEIDNAGTFFINGDGSDQTTKWHTGSAYVNAKLDVRQLAIAFSGSDKVTSNTSGDFTFSNTLTVGSIADEGDAIITNGASSGRYDVLTVKEDGNTRWELSFEGESSTNSLTFGSNVSEQNIANGGVLTLLPDGNVGVGCSPDSKLKVQENTNGDNVAFALRAFNDSGAGQTAIFTLDPDAKTLTLGTSNIINDINNERIGIGTTSPSASRLHVQAPDALNSTEYLVTMQNLETTDGHCQGLFINAGQGSSDDALRIQTRPGTEALRVKGNGAVTMASTLGVTGLITASAGVAIGGTGSANTLDDYEEGTWTPSLSYQNPSGVSLSYDFQVGLYTKIGNIVHVRFSFRVDISGSPVNDNILIAGLPFTSQNATNSEGSNVANDLNITGKAGYMANTSTNNTVASIVTSDIQGNQADDIGVGSNIQFHGGITYIAA